MRHPAICPICKKEFSTGNGLLGHIRFAHRNPLADTLRQQARLDAVADLRKVLNDTPDLLPETKASIALHIANLTRP